MQKKAKKNFQIAKIHMQKKKQEIIFQKKMQKKAEMQKKGCKKKAGGVLYFVQFQGISGQFIDFFRKLQNIFISDDLMYYNALQ